MLRALFGFNKYLVYVSVALIIAGLSIGGVAYWKHTIRQEAVQQEQLRIKAALQEDADRKLQEAGKNAEQRKGILDQLTIDELAEYFHTGKLPERFKNHNPNRNAPGDS